MSASNLHPTPQFRDVVREQVRAVGASLIREALVAAVVIAIATLIIGVDISTGNAATWFDSDEWFPIAIAGFLFPFAVWRRQARFGPSFFWTLPVDRRRLALSKVFAGWLWLMTAVSVFILWQLALAAFSGIDGAETVRPFVITGVSAMYLLGSAMVLGLRHPLRWLLGAISVVVLLGMLSEAVTRRPDRIDMLLDSTGLFSIIRSSADGWLRLPEYAQAILGGSSWLAFALLALFAALSRHGERRRS
jgi:hypothetical protein